MVTQKSCNNKDFTVVDTIALKGISKAGDIQYLDVDGMASDNEKLKRCPICGCTEHRLIGCHKHKENHRKGPDGRCIVDPPA